jgi:tetratricopeptide (TPR) repeat protein
LANSYRDAGELDKAIETFRKRIEIGGWIEEVWHSYYNIGICYRMKGEMEKAICAWVDAFQAHPKRIESLQEIIHHYRNNGKNDAAYMYYAMADASRKRWGPSNDYLFMQKDVYDYKIDYEMSIIGYYANYANYSLPKICMNVLAYPHLNDGTAYNVMNNYKFYTSKIVDQAKSMNQPLLQTATDSLDLTENGVFVKSTPSILLRGNHLIVNVRYVNYRIDENGNYVNQENIITKNAIATLDISKPVWRIVDEFEILYDKSKDDRYVGLEDIRIFLQDSSIIYNANRGMPDGSMTVENGKIAMDSKSTKDSKWLKGKHHIEKNWVILPGGDKGPQVIYHWTPELTIGEIRGDTFVETRRQPVPAFFKNLRGSTNGVVIKDELWLICHAVSYEDRRYYYHIVVVLDKDTFALKRYTPFWTFEGEKVEYTLGFVYLEGVDQLLIGYSVYDKCAKYVQMDRAYFEEQMIPFS